MGMFAAACCRSLGCSCAASSWCRPTEQQQATSYVHKIMVEMIGECTYLDHPHKLSNQSRMFLVLFPMLEHGYVVPYYNVAFRCKLGSNKRYRRSCSSFIDDKWQLAMPSSGNFLQTMSLARPPLPFPALHSSKL